MPLNQYVCHWPLLPHARVVAGVARYGRVNSRRSQHAPNLHLHHTMCVHVPDDDGRPPNNDRKADCNRWMVPQTTKQLLVLFWGVWVLKC